MPKVTIHEPPNQIEVYYKARGKEGAPVVVFAHGLLFSSAMWRKVIDLLEHQYRCISVDFRGHGRSQVTDGGYGIKSLAADIAAFIRELNLAPCHFIGFSLGGFVGLQLGLLHPTLVRSLVLIGTSAGAEPEPSRVAYRRLARTASFPWPVGKLLVVPKVRKTMFGKRYLASCTNRWRAAWWLWAAPRRGIYQGAMAVIDRDSVEERLHKIEAPTLVLRGEKDQARTREDSELLAMRIPNGWREVGEVKGAGHMVPDEDPAWVASRVAGFLSKAARPNPNEPGEEKPPS
jgi:pimeloyl-ACP methyl ester carboxylesterase